ncbi:4-hydroxyphenylacetate 3-monooxygenase [Pilibacter termitis]|uniref:4-hydroxyphenylacetate 3-monooxygenase n=1 Tax=Pilibacter termitis TaxID=263852 RepID=A0A1T4MW10_9ENTE|nr:4-hydroxyphenylacetate 3-hydroxylase N-terminal domain-containing protein [Pilibacter termitis]SJZ71026.1 4-hydroxyphenylacetate 3-monooxygenase [Pilibacter termitis]
MTTKNGDLRDGRLVYFEGKKVEDFSSIRVFADTLKVIQRYYELQEEEPEVFTYEEGGKRYSRTFFTPKNANDLAMKRKAYARIASVSYGMLGRTPDFINAGVAILENYAENLGVGEYTNFAENIKNWAKMVKEEDLFVSHALQNPQVDRSKTMNQLLKEGHEFAGVWVKESYRDGIVVQGAKMVNTLAPLADELLVFNVPNLSPEDNKFGLAFSVPLATKGVKVMTRKSSAKYDYSVADYPLSNRFDELDAFLIFEDVFIPWERVFVFGSAKKSNQFFEKSGLFMHTAHQDEVRGVVKLEFVTALAKRIAISLGLTDFLRVQEMLGKLTRNLELVRGTLHFAEVSGHEEFGVFTPNMQSLLAVRDSLPEMYDEVLSAIQEFSAGSIVGVPDVRDFAGENADSLENALSSPLLSAKERTILLNLAWDVTGESFGQRQRAYEHLHGGNTMWIKVEHWQHEDLSFGEKMLKDALNVARTAFDEEVKGK